MLYSVHSHRTHDTLIYIFPLKRQLKISKILQNIQYDQISMIIVSYMFLLYQSLIFINNHYYQLKIILKTTLFKREVIIIFYSVISLFFLN